MTRSAPSPAAGHDWRLGPYRLLSLLGTGATAQVFKAEHRHLGQLRALKILLAEHATHPDQVGRLVTEARAMARLRHPAIAEVFECDILDDGTAFIAMEYLRGEPMRVWMERVGKLNAHPLLAAAIAGTVAEGLSYAHRGGVIHRDLKPENVLLIPDPEQVDRFSLKILDFGIAKLQREEPLTRTRSGCVIGTPTFMAPEQWRPGSAIDHRADIYALGCMLFELLAGRPPFTQTNDLALMRAHLDDPAPALGALVKRVPLALAALVGRMLAKSPGDRPQNSEAVIAALESAVGQDRTHFTDLLRAPAAYAVTVRESAEIEPRHVLRTLIASGRSGARAVMLAMSAWRRWQGVRRLRLLVVSLTALAAVGLATFWLLRTNAGEQPPEAPARPEATPGPTAGSISIEKPRAADGRPDPRPAQPPGKRRDRGGHSRAPVKRRAAGPPGSPDAYRMVDD